MDRLSRAAAKRCALMGRADEDMAFVVQACGCADVRVRRLANAGRESGFVDVFSLCFQSRTEIAG